MDYFESAEGVTLTIEQAIQEIRDHCVESEIDDFFKIYGYKEFYKAQDVLVWLGY